MAVEPEEAARLVRAAAAGDRASWEALVDAYSGLLWAIARNHRLEHTDAADVTQTTWLRLLENLDRLTDPARVGAWLATTARRECLRIIGHSRRTVLVADDVDLEPAAEDKSAEIDLALLQAERGDAVRAAMAMLPERCQALLNLLMQDPAPSYEEISAALDMPIGSIGPTRGRCLRRLRHLLEAAGIDADMMASG